MQPYGIRWLHPTGRSVIGDIMLNTTYSINQFMGKLAYDISPIWKVDLSTIFVVSNDVETPGNYWHSYGLSKQDFNRSNTYLDIQRNTLNNQLVVSPYYSVYKEDNYSDNSAESSRYLSVEPHNA